MKQPSEPADGGPAFPSGNEVTVRTSAGTYGTSGHPGMSLRDWFAGQALANAAICTGKAADWELTAWFGPHKTGITQQDIVSAQAYGYADAMLRAREARETEADGS